MLKGDENHAKVPLSLKKALILVLLSVKKRDFEQSVKRILYVAIVIKK